MCPHFDEDEDMCSLHSSDSWENEVRTFGYDFITEGYCFASEDSSDSGEDNTGYSNCGMYKLNEQEGN